MQEDEILKVLLDWNFWEKEAKTGIRRVGYTDFIYPFLKTNQAVSISGIRRSGKSTIMVQMAKKLIESGTDPRDTLIVNFEDYRLYGISLKLLQNIYEVYLKRSAGKTKFVFLDEIHKVAGWERFARTLIDKGDAKVIVSGSNSKLISNEYATLLTGRYVKVLVFPLSFREFLLFRGVDPENETRILSEEPKVRQLLDEFIEYGGFPEVVLAEEGIRKKIVSDYVESTISKDVAERHKIRERAKLDALARYYLSNISTLISFNMLKNHINVPLRTVERFSYYLEEAYLIHFLKRFSFKVKEQERSPRKVYSADTGLSNALGFRFSRDYGKVMENVVFIELMKANANNPNFEVYYWQDVLGKEVDFVIKYGPKICWLIQVCYDASDPTVKKREISNLVKASVELNCEKLAVITNDYDGEEEHTGKRIRFISLWKWLLNPKLT